MVSGIERSIKPLVLAHARRRQLTDSDQFVWIVPTVIEDCPRPGKLFPERQSSSASQPRSSRMRALRDQGVKLPTVS